MSKTTSPTARTLNLLRAEGFEVDVVERRLPHCCVSVDLFNMFDLIAVRADLPGSLGVQCTSGANHAARVRKLLANPVLPVWLRAGNGAVVVSWRKVKGKWLSRREALTGAEPAAGAGQAC
jgi:hypothetical protein